MVVVCVLLCLFVLAMCYTSVRGVGLSIWLFLCSDMYYDIYITCVFFSLNIYSYTRQKKIYLYIYLFLHRVLVVVTHSRLLVAGKSENVRLGPVSELGASPLYYWALL